MKTILKHIKSLLRSDSDITFAFSFLRVLFCAICVLFSSSYIYMHFTTPKSLHYIYDGIKYHKENLELAECIKIEVDGEYKSRSFGYNDEFVGKIKIGDIIFDFSDYPLKLNKYKMGVLDTDMSSNYGFYGMMFINSMFKKITIEIHEYKGDGVYCANQWMISAPCKNVKEAVELSQRLIRR